MALLGLICGNSMECQNKILKIFKYGNNFILTFVDHYWLADINFNGHHLIKNNIPIPKKVIALYISYKLNPKLRNLNLDFTLNNSLFGSVKLTKNVDIDKYKDSCYNIAFDSCSELLFTH